MLLLSLTPLHPPSTLFPYTTLFRSRRHGKISNRSPLEGPHPVSRILSWGHRRRPWREPSDGLDRARLQAAAAEWRINIMARSEEHTSELQSHHDLVCRLLLEKKKKK